MSLPPESEPVRLSGDPVSYDCRVESTGDDWVIVVPNEDNPAGRPSSGSSLMLRWASARGQFDLPVLFGRAEDGPRPRWRLDADGEVQVVQRRQYVRTALDQSAEFHRRRPDGKTDMTRCYLVDISEGGAACSFPPGVLAEDDAGELRFDLEGPVELYSHVLRMTPRLSNLHVVLVFNPPREIGERIRRYVFAQQAAERRKRLGLV